MSNSLSINTAEAILLFDAGSLSGAKSVKAVLEDGYLMYLDGRKGLVYTLASQREDIRIFKSANAVLATAKKIGFKKVEFHI